MTGKIITAEMIAEDMQELTEHIESRTAEGLQDEVLYRRILEMKRLDGFNGQLAENKLLASATKLKCHQAVSKLYKAYKIREARNMCAIGGNYTHFTDQPIALSCGDWIADDAGIRKQVSNRMGDIETKFASRTPLLITEIYKNVEATENIEKVRIAYCDGGIWKSTIVSNEVICESRNITRLSGLGIDVTSNTAKLLIDYFQTIKTGNQNEIPVCESIGRMGWTDDGGFSPYSGLKFDGETEARQLYEAISTKGSYELWKEQMTKLRENRYFRLQMAAAFAAPILKKIDALPFILHYHGTSGYGKTLGMLCAMSVWGDPHLGKLCRILNNTTNTTPALAGILHNIPVALDELQTIKSYTSYDTLIMQICSGVERGRLNANGTMRQVRTWQTTFITTGEEPIVRENSGGGSVNRVIEVDCNDKNIIPEGQGKTIAAFIYENYGHAGEIFINKVREHTNLKSLYSNYLDEILKETNTTEKQASSMAAMMTADLVAVAHIFDNEELLKVKDIADLLADKRSVDVTERAYDFVMDTISANTYKFDSGTYNECWGRINNDDTVLINKSILTKMMLDNGFDFNACKKKWAAKGYLELNSQGRYYHFVQCGGVKGYYVKLHQKIEEVKNLNDTEPPF